MTRRRLSLPQRLVPWMFLLLPASSSGCFFLCTLNEEDTALKYDADLLNDSMQSLLRPGSCALRAFAPSQATPAKLEVHAFEGNGSHFGFVSGTAGAALEVSADGKLVATVAAPGELEAASAAALGSGFLAVTCRQGGARLAYFEQAAEVRSSTLSNTECDAVVGAANLSAGVLATRVGDGVSLRRVDAQLELTGARATTVSGATRLRLADEPRDGVLAVAVQRASGGWLYREVDDTGATTVEHTAELGGDSNDGVRARRDGDGALLVATGDVLVRWHVEGDGHIEPVQTATPPDIGTQTWSVERWFGGGKAMVSEPNVDEPSLDVPLAYRSRAAGADGFVVLRPANTPCRADDFCRNVGESYLAGVIAHADKAWGIYDVWAWAEVVAEGSSGKKQALHAVYASPLFASTDPVNAWRCEGIALDAGVDGGSGGSGGSEAGDASDDVEADVSAGGIGGSGGAGGVGGVGGVGGGGGGGAAGMDAGDASDDVVSDVSTDGSGGTTACDAGATDPLTGTPTLIATLTQSDVQGLAVDDSYIYVSQPNARNIVRVEQQTGTRVELYTDPNPPTGLTLEGTDLFWTTSEGELRRAPASGAGPVSAIATVGYAAQCLAVDGTHAYIGRNTTAPIARVALADGTIESLATFDAASGIAIGSQGDLLFGDTASDVLWNVPISGAAATEFAQLGAGRQVMDIERDGTTVWVASAGTFEILRIDETCKTVSIAYGADARALALSPTHVFWVSFTSGVGYQLYSLPR